MQSALAARHAHRAVVVVLVVSLAVFAAASIPVLKGFGLLGSSTATARGEPYGGAPPRVIAQLRVTAASFVKANLTAGATPPTSAEVVQTTYADALKGTSGDILPASAPNPSVYAVQVLGSFTAYEASTPPGAPMPTGSALTFILNPSSGRTNDWGVGAPVDLSGLGTVYRIPVSITSTASSPTGVTEALPTSVSHPSRRR